MNSYSVIIPNRFEDIIQPLITSIISFEPKQTHVVIIADNHTRDYGFDMVKTKGRFIFSHAVNAGLSYIYPNDIILVNDDVRLIQSDTFETMQEAAYSDPRIGILSPLIDGGCSNRFMKPSNIELWSKSRQTIGNIHYCTGHQGDRISFACVYIKRQCLNKLGPFDENFKFYGYEDADMCIRAIKNGWKLAITNKTTVVHGTGGDTLVRGKNWNSSFIRTGVGGTRINLKYLMEKYADLHTLRRSI